MASQDLLLLLCEDVSPEAKTPKHGRINIEKEQEH